MYTTPSRLVSPCPSFQSWFGQGDYADDSHQFVDVSRRLHLLDITPDRRSAVALTSLLQKFDEVDELRLIVHIPQVRSYQLNLLKTNRISYDLVVYIAFCFYS